MFDITLSMETWNWNVVFAMYICRKFKSVKNQPQMWEIKYKNLSKNSKLWKELFKKKYLMPMKMPVYYKFNFAKIEKKNTNKLDFSQRHLRLDSP